MSNEEKIRSALDQIGTTLAKGLADLASGKPWFANRPDAQAFDEVRIVTVPRWKTSGLSGDEWRISAETRFLRKGLIVHTVRRRDVETAAGYLFADWGDAIGDGKAWFGGGGEACDQEGCAERATVTYRLRKLFCREGHATEPHRPTFRRFCEAHKTRGDCALEDADANYERVEPV
jgi:hypothetical protein